MAENKSYVFGIDLGMTYSHISYLKDGHPVVCQSLEGENTTPSVVRIMPEEDFPVVGRTAKDMSVIYPDYTIQFVKSKIGHVDSFEYGPEEDRHSTSPVDVSAEILKKLASDASAYTNTTVKDVVITVPTYFGYDEKNATRQAGIEAGLNVIDIVEDPIAVAYYYSSENSPDPEVTSSHSPPKKHDSEYKEVQVLYGPPSVFSRDDENIDNFDQVALESESTGKSFLDRFTNKAICVFDLGGGTFDVTALKMENGKMIVLTTDGSHALGGRNWDAELIEMVKEKFKEATGYDEEFDSEILQDIQLKCETAKRQLTNVSQTNIPITIDRKNKANITITREEFDSRTSYLLATAIDLTHQVFDRMAERGEPITKILLVGGSSFMPQVSEAIRSEFNVPIELNEPNEAVSKGACIYAAWKVVNTEVGGSIGEEVIREVIINEEGQTVITIEGVNGTKNKVEIALPSPIKKTKIVTVATKSYGIMAKVNGEPKIVNLVNKDDKLPFEFKTDEFSIEVDNQTSVSLNLYQNTSFDHICEVEEGDLVVESTLDGLPNNLPAGTCFDLAFTLAENGLIEITGSYKGTPLNGKLERICDGVSSKEV